MTLRTRTLLLVVAAASAPAMAQPGFVQFGIAIVWGVSADGRTAVGDSSSPRRWSAATGVQNLGTTARGVAYACSIDGSIIVGNLNDVPFCWTMATGIQMLPLPPGTVPQTESDARGVSADGTVIGGTVWDSASGSYIPVTWRNGTLEVPTLPPGWRDVIAEAVSGDGSVVIGTRNYYRAGYRWTAAAGFEDVPPMPQQPHSPLGSVYPRSISHDGTVIVGAREPTPIGGWVPFRWRYGQAVENLPIIPGFNHGIARDVSDDGKTVIGYVFNDASSYNAFIWKEGRGSMLLRDYLAEVGVVVPAGVTLSLGKGLSASGLVIFGQCFGTGCPGGAFRAEVPCPANCDGSTAAPVLNVADFICFLNRFAAGDSRANCDASTTPPVLSVADFVCFQTQFAAGCP
ncbi:MAG: hypothetical protein JNM80_09690 [Phycisphaerae bacterium]|nr:hypothetical protein [Phycisphaerae bacterium]